MKIRHDDIGFLNLVAKKIDSKYFAAVKYYRDNQNCADVHYALECFSNGVLTYNKLITKLAKTCKETKENIHNIVKDYVTDFEGYEYKPNEK